MDRLDYLNRDSFYSGVSEGIIGSDRLIDMLTVHDGNLVMEEKGIYSIEKFIVSRRLMYWQVYLHKTVVAAEFMLIHALRRAKELITRGDELFGSPALLFFLKNHITEKEFESNPEVLKNFALLDDYDILGALKIWQHCHDRVLSMLSSGIVNRNLFKIEISRDPYSEDRVSLEKEIVKSSFKLSDEEVHYFVYTDVLSNKAYNENKQNINLMMKSGEIMDLSKASDNLNISALAQPVEKFFICYPI
jgi:HD superfamily phosphohydrolase